MLREAITWHEAVQIDWPDNVSIYKRGELTDVFESEISSGTDNRSEPMNPSLQCYPNPFDNEINIAFSVLSHEGISLGIYNILGQKVKGFSDEVFPKGSCFNARWDGKASTGNYVPSGIYLVRLVSADLVIKEQILFQKNCR
jgi:hypothetical protein